VPALVTWQGHIFVAVPWASGCGWGASGGVLSACLAQSGTAHPVKASSAIAGKAVRHSRVKSANLCRSAGTLEI
jgi:hypothetical protein